MVCLEPAPIYGLFPQGSLGMWDLLPSHSSPAGTLCAAYLDNANGGGINGGGLRDVVQIINPHSKDLKGAEGSE